MKTYINTTGVVFGEEYPEDFTFTPAYPDTCGHGGYLGTVRTADGHVADVYVYEERPGKQNACIRHSAEASDYSSPGTPLDLLLAAAVHRDMVVYRLAALLISRYMKITFSKES
jgi:hypothetical protein